MTSITTKLGAESTTRNYQEFELLNGEVLIKITTDTGALNAHGSVQLSAGGTTLLVTATFDPQPVEGDFVPLRVDYVERFYAIHDILGSRYTRREGPPSDGAILSSRLIDRTLRPNLPSNLRNPLHVVVMIISLGDQDPDTLGIIGASLAIQQSGLTWNGPVFATRTSISTSGETENIPVMPNFKSRSMDSTKAQLVMAGTGDLISALEFEGFEITEGKATELYLKGLEVLTKISEEFKETNFALNSNTIVEAVNAEISQSSQITTTESEYRSKLLSGWREDGRSAGETRKLSLRVKAIDGLHGDAMFSRGDTTVLSVTTLDTLQNTLLVENIEGTGNQRFIHHYNFPPFAVGKSGKVDRPNRREIGHGALVYRALKGLLPDSKEYPYTIRLVSEVLSSNGSSSMASVCAGSLSLYSAGIPISRLCAGISVGAVGDLNNDNTLLADITAPEDQHGDMDFKIAGTQKGITAMQLDVKNRGISVKTYTQALAIGKSAREKILEKMSEELESNGKKFSHPESAPLVVEIPRAHIGRLIGRGGSNIKEIEVSTGAHVSIESDRFAIIIGTNEAKADVLKQIESETRTYNVGEDFKSKVREFLPYGAIVELEAGREALLHVSELRDEFVERAEDLLKVGDEVPVTIVETSSDGRIKVSIREKYPDFFK